LITFTCREGILIVEFLVPSLIPDFHADIIEFVCSHTGGWESSIVHCMDLSPS
jgi:hypothetical protein